MERRLSAKFESALLSFECCGFFFYLPRASGSQTLGLWKNVKHCDRDGEFIQMGGQLFGRALFKMCKFQLF